MHEEPAVVHIDGAARGNPGPAAFAFIIAPPHAAPIEEHGVIGLATNNVAEYTALLRALEKAAALSLPRLRILSDSELLVKQMLGEYRVKNPDLQDLNGQAQALLRNFRAVSFAHVRREHNKRADELCNLALDGERPKPDKKPKSAKKKTKATDAAVRDDAIACLEAARHAWRSHNARAPSAEQVWDQLWSVLEEGNVLK